MSKDQESAPARFDPTVWVVDDDTSVRRSLERLLTACGYRVRGCASAEEFLASDWPDAPGCLVLDVRLPDLNGLELQKVLQETGVGLPVVFLTGHGDVPMSVRAIKAGGIDFLLKGSDDEALLTAIEQALTECKSRLAVSAELAIIQGRLDSLSRRERQVLTQVVAGRLNKQIATDLGIGLRTVKLHRAHIMQKLDVSTVADLVRLVEKASPESPDG
ncbi:MAG: response regulator [Actinobacteria bacterium]|nr:response regulator [Actinomycetota bacterium]